MDGRVHPENPIPTRFGHSIGRWDGDWLVIDIIGYNDKFWFDSRGTPSWVSNVLRSAGLWGVVSRGRKGDIREFGWQSRSEPGLGFVDQAWCIPRPGEPAKSKIRRQHRLCAIADGQPVRCFVWVRSGLILQ